MTKRRYRSLGAVERDIERLCADMQYLMRVRESFKRSVLKTPPRQVVPPAKTRTKGLDVLRLAVDKPITRHDLKDQLRMGSSAAGKMLCIMNRNDLLVRKHIGTYEITEAGRWLLENT